MTDKSKYLLFIIAVLCFALGASIWRGLQKEAEPNYKSQYDSIVVESNRKISTITARNKFTQDSLTRLLIARKTEENGLKNEIKNNDNIYEKKIRTVDTFGLVSSIELRSKLREDFRHTYGY